MRNTKQPRSLTGLLWGASALLTASTAYASPLDQALTRLVRANVAAAKSQERIDTLSNQTREMLTRYRRAQEQIASLGTYNHQLETLIASQEEEVASLREQIDNATTTARELTPLMLRMLDALASFVELDAPFLLRERRDRVAMLRELMNRADVTNSEKFRRLIEAYQVENDYGRTIEAYQEKLGEDVDERTVNLLRIGRIVLIYQTLDEREAGVWNQNVRQWTKLPKDYRSAIRQGLRIARKQTAPDLIRLPIPAPTDIEGGRHEG